MTALRGLFFIQYNRLLTSYNIENFNQTFTDSPAILFYHSDFLFCFSDTFLIFFVRTSKYFFLFLAFHPSSHLILQSPPVKLSLRSKNDCGGVSSNCNFTQIQQPVLIISNIILQNFFFRSFLENNDETVSRIYLTLVLGF